MQAQTSLNQMTGWEEDRKRSIISCLVSVLFFGFVYLLRLTGESFIGVYEGCAIFFFLAYIYFDLKIKKYQSETK
jgi:hypothetical protein